MSHLESVSAIGHWKVGSCKMFLRYTGCSRSYQLPEKVFEYIRKSYIFIRRGFLQPRTLLASLGGLINRFFLISLMTKFSFLFVTVEGGPITVCCILDPCFCIYNISDCRERSICYFSDFSQRLLVIQS